MTAVFGKTATAQCSTSTPVGLTLTKGKSGIALMLAADSAVYGSASRLGAGRQRRWRPGHRHVRRHVVRRPGHGSRTADFTFLRDSPPAGTTVSAVFNGTDKVDPSGIASAA